MLAAMIEDGGALVKLLQDKYSLLTWREDDG
jgi:hypothetical protein